MKMVRTALFMLLGLFVAFVLGGFFLPKSAHVERSVQIDAPPAEVFAVVRDLREFNSWSPWHGIDPDTVYTYAGEPGMVGSSIAWHSDNPEVGSGNQSIIALEPDRRVYLRLDFGDEGEADSYYLLVPKDGGTVFTWGFDLEFGANPIERYFGLVLDRFVGTPYEAGLAKLKARIESR